LKELRRVIERGRGRRGLRLKAEMQVTGLSSDNGPE
jgi:hypothetical protein